VKGSLSFGVATGVVLLASDGVACGEFDCGKPPPVGLMGFTGVPGLEQLAIRNATAAVAATR